MEIGTLVMHESDMHQGMGIVMTIECQHPKSNGEYRMVTVHWLDGMGVGLYWTDELEVICS